jgi:hypothetical protein
MWIEELRDEDGAKGAKLLISIVETKNFGLTTTVERPHCTSGHYRTTATRHESLNGLTDIVNQHFENIQGKRVRGSRQKITGSAHSVLIHWLCLKYSSQL